VIETVPIEVRTPIQRLSRKRHKAWFRLIEDMVDLRND
jgi:hypothetical protein